MNARVVLLSLLAVVLLVAPGGSSTVLAAGPTAGTLRTIGAASVRDVTIRVPTNPSPGPLQAVIALHGMGGNGRDFAASVADQADRYGWLIVAPTIRYGDWTNPDQIAREDPALSAWLASYVRHLNLHAGRAVKPRVLVFGHSRGAQLALRFAEIHPRLTAAVAAVSAGTYTLPVTRDAQSGQLLEFPFGVANLARDDGGTAFDAHGFAEVPVWIGVGAEDSNPNDVPDQWDPFIGDDRRDRAQRFSEVVAQIGGDVTLEVFPGLGHGLTDAMRGAAWSALAEAVNAGAAIARSDSAH